LATLEVIVATQDRFGLLIPDDEWPQTIGIGRYIEEAAAPSNVSLEN
jgi:acyl carrier protein